MFLIKDESLMMAVSQGDSAYFTITFTGDIPEDGTTTMFTVKKDLNGQALLQKYLPVYDGVVDVELYSNDTNKLEPGNYLWDIRVLFSEKEVVTPMVPSPFVVLEVSGDV